MALAALPRVVSLRPQTLMATLPSSWVDLRLLCSSVVFIQLERLEFEFWGRFMT